MKFDTTSSPTTSPTQPVSNSTSPPSRLQRPIPDPNVPAVAFPSGVTTADVSYTKGEPVGTGQITDLDPVLLSDRTRTSVFTFYFAPAAELHPLITSGGASVAADPFDDLRRATLAYHQSEGSMASKQAAAPRLVVDETLAVCLPRLQGLEHSLFVLLPPAPSKRPAARSQSLSRPAAPQTMPTPQGDSPVATAHIPHRDLWKRPERSSGDVNRHSTNKAARVAIPQNRGSPEQTGWRLYLGRFSRRRTPTSPTESYEDDTASRRVAHGLMRTSADLSRRVCFPAACPMTLHLFRFGGCVLPKFTARGFVCMGRSHSALTLCSPTRI